MKTIKEFSRGDRYVFDYQLCKGWAQLDNEQDAWYYGEWACPTLLKYCAYMEGDIVIKHCDTVEEFVTLIEHVTDTEDFIGIDPGLDEDKRNRWKDIGLGHLLEYKRRYDA